MRKKSGRMKTNQSVVSQVKGADSIGNSVVALHGRRLCNFGDLKILVHDQGIYCANYVIYISLPSFGLHKCTIALSRARPFLLLLLFGGIMVVSTCAAIRWILFTDSFLGEYIFFMIITWYRIWYNIYVAPQQEIASQYHGIYMIYIWAGFLSRTW